MAGRKLWINLSLWLALTALTGAFAGKTLDWLDYYRLAKRGVRTRGTVTAKTPEQHNFVHYSYSVGGVNYGGVGSAGDPNPPFDEIRIGDQVSIVYDPVKPHKSLMRDPGRQLSSVTVGVLFITLLFPPLVVLSWNAKGWV